MQVLANNSSQFEIIQGENMQKANNWNGSIQKIAGKIDLKWENFKNIWGSVLGEK